MIAKLNDLVTAARKAERLLFLALGSGNKDSPYLAKAENALAEILDQISTEIEILEVEHAAMRRALGPKPDLWKRHCPLK